MFRKQLNGLFEKMETKVNRQNALLTLRNGAGEVEGRALTDDEAAEFSTLETEIVALKSQIETEQKYVDAAKRNAEMHFIDVNSESEDKAKRNLKKSFSVTRALAFVDFNNMDGAEAEVHEEGRRMATAAKLPITGKGILFPSFVLESRADSTTATAAGNMIPTLLGNVRQGYAPKLFLDELGLTRLNNLVGINDIPVEDLQAVTGWVGEATANTTVDVNLRKKTLSAKGIRSKIRSTWALSANAGGSTMDALIMSGLKSGEANQINKTLAKGGGANEPIGITDDTDVIDIAIGANGGPLTRNLLLQLMNSPAKNDAEFANSYGWLTTPGVRQFLQGIKVDAGSGKFVWPDGVPNELMGHKAMTSTLVPSATTKGTGTNLNSIVFGAWNQAIVANWDVRELFLDKYTDETAVWLNMISFWDIKTINPKAFAKINDVDIS